MRSPNIKVTKDREYSVDALSRTTHHLQLALKATDVVLSSATSFIYERRGNLFLITNWHVVSGRSPLTHECLDSSLAVPDFFATYFNQRETFFSGILKLIDLYRDDSMREPLWYEHPVHASAVDVVALPLPIDLQEDCEFFPINGMQFDAEYVEMVADEAFVIGYPFSEFTTGHLPIWKKASIATEPFIDVDSLPKMLIDTATRPGLSGSPVVMQRNGIHGMKGNQMTGKELIGRIRNFIGIYSGRVGRDTEKAQLGVVWKAKVIDEIIDAKILGKSPHHPLPVV
ncbi:MAG: hypothetical protein EOO28_35835 [Comamonadaceae bacterium]|nr:MAG: hypothetical protein EOO28_35835 [Comamonadaceae bacterium]